MKTATKQIPVYSSDGTKLIGTLECGAEALVIGEDTGGTYIAYIVGRILPADAINLVDSAQWEAQVSVGDKFLSFVAAQVGCLYVLGAQGQKMTEALIKKLEHVSDKDYKRALAQFNKHVKSGETLVAYDCSGLIVAHLLAEKLIQSDKTANGLYFDECTAIEKAELCGGDLVFKKSLTQNRMYHVGVYMGDGTVVHAKGRDDGVVRENISATGWNRFGRLKCIGGPAAPVFTRQLKNKGKPYMSGDDVRAVQQALLKAGYDPQGIDGSFGPKTEKAVKAYQAAAGLEADGVVGKLTWASLMA